MKILRIHLSLTAQNVPVIANNLTDFMHTLRMFICIYSVAIHSASAILCIDFITAIIVQHIIMMIMMHA